MACHDYDDILHLSRPVSGRHARMSMVDRGAQFSPFAALVGYEKVLAESARLTEAETFLAGSCNSWSTIWVRWGRSASCATGRMNEKREAAFFG